MERAAAAALIDALSARGGIVCTVGAGGKKSTLYRLIEAHLALGTAPVGLTATVMTAPPPREVAPERLIAGLDRLQAELPARAAAHRLLAFAAPSPKPGRLGGLPPAEVAALHDRAGFALTLVKADGARMRLIKAPGPDEPLIPSGAGTVLALLSIAALHRPLDPGVAHRPERVAAVTGAALGERLAPVHLARLLASEAGALQNTMGALVVPVINMVDGEAERAAARAIARDALARTSRFNRVILAAMLRPNPLVELVTR